MKKFLIGAVAAIAMIFAVAPPADAGIFFGNGKAQNRQRFRQELRNGGNRRPDVVIQSGGLRLRIER